MDKTRQQAPSSRIGLLEGIDRGRYAEALAFVEREPEVLDSPEDALLRTELALYRDQLAETEAILDRLRGSDLWIDDASEVGSRARRTRLLKVEVACFSGDLDEAERLVRPMVDAAVRVQDYQSELRALYDLARIARHRAEWTLAIDRLDRALELARQIGNQCYEGRVAYTLGLCWYNLNRLDLAIPYLQAALRLLTVTENLRFRATVESFYGCLLSDGGDPKAALQLLEHAEATVGELGIVSDMVMARMNAARTRLALGQYEEVERSLTELLGWERGLGGTPTELITLRLLAITQCVAGRIGEARRSAEEALRLAEIRGNTADRLEARLLVARAKSLAGEDDARAQLDALVAEVDESGTPYLQAEARIYLARALLAADPTRARSVCDAVRVMPVVSDFDWLRRELDFVEADLRYMPVRLTSDGQLIMDARFGWPDIKSAREAAERYWFERALVETDGNVSAASRLLGLTRNEGHYLYKLVVKGEPARPSRSRTPNAPGSGPRRRPRS
ncbi:MAG: tetratricopeptide repeat protein [Blastocatellia bacterium]|jgi:tetratricopeptide (TPR) repeat protein